jgi:hypothetical protein
MRQSNLDLIRCGNDQGFLMLKEKTLGAIFKVLGIEFQPDAMTLNIYQSL